MSKQNWEKKNQQKREKVKKKKLKTNLTVHHKTNLSKLASSLFWLPPHTGVDALGTLFQKEYVGHLSCRLEPRYLEKSQGPGLFLAICGKSY